MENVEKLKLFLVDEHLTALQSLKNIIKYNFNHIEIVGESNTVEESIKKIDNTDVELLILDIEIPDGYGFDILQGVSYKNFEVIITSSHPNYAIRAYEISALHFLQKPVT